MAGKRKFLWLVIFDTAYTTLTFSAQDLQDVLVQMARVHIWNRKDQFAMKVQKSSPLLILQIPWRPLRSSCLSVITQSCSTWLLAAISVMNIKKQGISRRPRDAVSAEGVKARKPRQYCHHSLYFWSLQWQKAHRPGFICRRSQITSITFIGLQPLQF